MKHGFLMNMVQCIYKFDSPWSGRGSSIQYMFIQSILYTLLKNLAASKALPHGRTYGECARCFGSQSSDVTHRLFYHAFQAAQQRRRRDNHDLTIAYFGHIPRFVLVGDVGLPEFFAQIVETGGG